MKITFISDTHTKHEEIHKDLPGGDLIIHAGDFMNSGYDPIDVTRFVNWYSSLLTMDYKHRVFIAGNHDGMFEDNPDLAKQLMDAYSGGLIYLQDQSHIIYDEDMNVIVDGFERVETGYLIKTIPHEYDPNDKSHLADLKITGGIINTTEE